jgi:transposase
VDTHKGTHTLAVVDANGGEVAIKTIRTSAAGYGRMLAFGRDNAPGGRIWAIEGSGSFGAGLTAHLLEQAERVVEVDRPMRRSHRSGAKTDELDAVRAARQALGQRHLCEPRRRGSREALRVLARTRQGAVAARTGAICHLKALVVTAPEDLRQQVRALPTGALVDRCAAMRDSSRRDTERAATVSVLRSTARRIQALTAEADELEQQIATIMRTDAPALLEQPGVGALSGAELLIAWSHAGRLRSEAAFASLAGVAPIPASSGQITRHRLNRGGDRQLNRALHVIVLARLRHHPETRAYMRRRIAEGKSYREVRRCLKRFVARRLFKLMESTPMGS